MPPGAPLALLAGGAGVAWGLSLASALGGAAAGGEAWAPVPPGAPPTNPPAAEGVGPGLGAGPGGRETTMYFCREGPEGPGLGGAGAADTSFTTGGGGGAPPAPPTATGAPPAAPAPAGDAAVVNVITCNERGGGVVSRRLLDIWVPPRPLSHPPSDRTCWEALEPEAEDMTMNLVGGGEGWLGGAGRPPGTRPGTGSASVPGTFRRGEARGAGLCGACASVSVGRGCGKSNGVGGGLKKGAGSGSWQCPMSWPCPLKD